jgi:diguanylate cyclase (GGDEF)-like protein/PAS domain S-box-containing protein
MTSASLRRVLIPRTASPPLLPTSALVGIALPIVLLSVVFIGMGVEGPSLIAWAAAIGLIAFALPAPLACAVTLLAVVSGGLMLRLVSGEIPTSASFQLMAFIVTTLLAWTAGQLLSMLLRERSALTSSDQNLGVYEKVIIGMLESSRDCVKVLAMDGTILAINAAGLRQAGAVQDTDMLGHNWFALWDGDLQKTLAATWQKALQSGAAEFDGCCRILSGERRFWQNHFSFVQAYADQPDHMLCISRDSTENLAAQQALKTSLAQLNSLAANVDDGFCSLDSNWSILFANASAQQLLAIDAGQTLVGNNFWEFFYPSKNDEGAACIRRALERQCVQRCEYFSGSRQAWLGITAFPHASGVGVLIRDVTAVKVAEKHAAEENTRLQVAQKIAGFGDWSFDYDQGQMKLSPRAVALLGLVECPPHEHKKQLLERLHPQDRMALVQAIINSSAESARIDLTVRMPATDGGSDRHVHWIGKLIVDEHGNPQRMMGAVQDVSAHLSAQEAHDNARALVRDIIDVLPQGIGVFDRNGKIIMMNRSFENVREEIYGGMPAGDRLFGESSQNPLVASLAQQIAPQVRALFAGEIEQFQHEYRLPLGERPRIFALHAQLIESSDGKLILISHSDITSMVRMTEAAEQNEKQMRELLDNLTEIFWIYDLPTHRFTYFSSAAEKLLKVPCAELIEKQSMMDYIHPEDIQRVQSVLAARLTPGASAGYLEYRLIDACGDIHWITSNTIPLRNERNDVTCIHGITRDITGIRSYEQQLLTAAYIDDTTGLPNRKALLKELAVRVDRAVTEPFSLLLINIDRFKNINDTLGYGSGDLLLDRTGKRLREALDPQFYLARFGSDEFAVICPDAQRDAGIGKIKGCFENAFELNAERAFVTVSIGVAGCPLHSADGGELLRFVGVALQRAKASGRNNLQVFQDTMMLPSRERLALENELRTALQNEEFELFYQGKFELASNALTGAEVLLRWRSPMRGLVSPADFIPLLEETGLILPVGEWILKQACNQVRAWYERNGVWLPVAVNVSALQIVNRSFGDNAMTILQQSGVPAGIIELEITESALMSDAAHGGQLINTLKSAGYSIALDDFGTGYSNLSYLRRFAPNTLKIDRSFVAELTAKNSDRAIVGVVLQLAKALGIGVVAEGIETAEQQRILLEMNCRHGQGYLYCKPLPVEQFEQQIMNNPTPTLRRSQSNY